MHFSHLLQGRICEKVKKSSSYLELRKSFFCSVIEIAERFSCAVSLGELIVQDRTDGGFTVGFDKHLVDFLQIDPKSFEQRVLTGGMDDELLAWVVAQGKAHSHEEIAQWSPDFLRRV